MGFNTATLYKKALEIIPDKGVVFIDELVSYLPCSRQTFYDHFPLGSDKLDNLKEQLNKNKIATKQVLRKKWKDSDNATLQLALYKLLSNDDEMMKLSMQNVDVKTGGKPIVPQIIFSDDNDED